MPYRNDLDAALARAESAERKLAEAEATIRRDGIAWSERFAWLAGYVVVTLLFGWLQVRLLPHNVLRVADDALRDLCYCRQQVEALDARLGVTHQARTTCP